MRAIWKGYIRFSLVTIPIKVFKATEEKSLQFHNLHSVCHTRIRYEKKCPQHGVVSNDEIVKGYEYTKDHYVVLTEEDFAKVRLETTHAIHIAQFVEGREIDPIYFVSSYYLAPDGPAAKEAYSLLMETLKSEGRIALAKLVLRDKEYLVGLRPYNGAMVMSTMYYPDEIVSPQKLEGLEGKVSLQSEEIQLAKTLVNSLSRPFKPQEYKDEYTAALLEIIQKKIAGEEIAVAPKPEMGKVINLMDALKKSLAKAPTEVARKGMAKSTPSAKPVKKRQKA